MVGIALFPSVQIHYERQRQTKGAPIPPHAGQRRLSLQRTTGRTGVHAHKDLSSSHAFGDVFEAPGCPHKVADTRVNSTTDR
jgi:hypothetical protein